MADNIRNLTRAAAQQRRTHIVGVPQYQVSLDLRGASAVREVTREDGSKEFVPQKDTFESTTTITATFAAPEGTNLEITGTVDEVQVDGDPIEVRHDGHRLQLPPLDGEHTVIVRATCEYSTSGKGLTLVVDQSQGDVLCHTQGEEYGANLFFACFDQPDIKGRFSIDVTVDEGWDCISNEPVTEGPQGLAGGTFRFAPTPPISTYLVAVVPGAYHRIDGGSHNGIDLGLYVGAALKEYLEADAEEWFEVTRQGFDYFTYKFGRPYPFTKYDQLIVPGFRFGAMENPGCVTFTDRYVFRGAVTEAARASRANTILHEMAHMWFGDEVTMRWWDDLWLNESFATATSYYAEVAATRFSGALIEFASRMKRWAVLEDDRPTTHPIVADMPDIHSVHQNFDGITYAKGASTLLQLMHWVGEDAFFAGCATYFDEHALGNTSLEDFLGHLAAASGRDLNAWADAWLQTTGIGRIRLDVTISDETISAATLTQVTGAGEPDPRPHRLRVGVYTPSNGALRHARDIDADLPPTADPVPLEGVEGLPADAILVVNDGDHAYTKVVYDNKMLSALEESISSIDSVMARTVLWRSLWEMVRDAELPARRYAAMVAAHAPEEDDVTAVGGLLDTASAARWRYGIPSNADALEGEMAAVAKRELDSAAPESDLQLLWFKQWLGVANSTADHEQQAAMLGGEGIPTGIKLDPVIRWQIVSKLAAHGVFDDSDIDAELRNDPTDKGRLEALGARAARPTLDAKSDAWARLLTDPDLKVEQVRALSSAFASFRQAELLQPFVDRYFEDQATLWATRSEEDAILVMESAFPHPNPTEELVARVERTIASDELRPQAARSLREELDTLQRTLAARALDAEAGA